MDRNARSSKSPRKGSSLPSIMALHQAVVREALGEEALSWIHHWLLAPAEVGHRLDLDQMSRRGLAAVLVLPVPVAVRGARHRVRATVLG
ncbi:MAG: hypothetical protein WBH86_10720, partial [Thermogutta sp.]